MCRYLEDSNRNIDCLLVVYQCRYKYKKNWKTSLSLFHNNYIELRPQIPLELPGNKLFQKPLRLEIRSLNQAH